MARENTTQLTLDAPPDVVLEVMTSDAFNRARDEAQGAFDLRVRVIDDTATRFVYAVEASQFARGLRGEDRSRTESSTTTYDWDRTTRRATWSYSGPHGDRVHVTGTIALVPVGAQTRVDEQLLVDIQIPVIGGQIERLVMKEMKAGFATYERVLREHIASV